MAEKPSAVLRRLPAEWEKQGAILLALPHNNSDWSAYLDNILSFYKEMIETIARFEKVVLICSDAEEARDRLGAAADGVIFAEIPTNDTWARDFGVITVEENGEPLPLDFEFNGWGLKFAANFDNQVNTKLAALGLFGKTAMRKTGWILEGGSVESDGAGTLMTTKNCLLAPNRNALWSAEDFELAFAREFGAKRVLWLENGHLENDDTDAHIDTLARFCDPQTIAFTVCADRDDPHYEPLLKMRRELGIFRAFDGKPYKLIPLPLPKLFYDGKRLPATYANFLIINGAVIAPTYGVSEDAEALFALKTAFSNREIVPIDASVAARQYGSVHCLAMQLPKSLFTGTDR
jgi:agmatine deiminase